MRLLPVADTAVLLSAELGGPVPASVELRSEFHFLAVCEKMRREREAYLLSGPSSLEDRSFEGLMREGRCGDFEGDKYPIVCCCCRGIREGEPARSGEADRHDGGEFFF